MRHPGRQARQPVASSQCGSADVYETLGVNLAATPDVVQVMQNNRGALRHRVLKPGSIEFNGGAIDCVIRNISETGAALEVTSPVGIPETFNLVIPSDHTNRPCRVAWRRERRIGVRFT